MVPSGSPVMSSCLSWCMVHGVVVVAQVDHVGHVGGAVGTIVEEVVGVGFADPGTGGVAALAVTECEVAVLSPRLVFPETGLRPNRSTQHQPLHRPGSPR
jgi:hypothetical protein